MKTYYSAKDVPIMYFSPTADKQGTITPTICIVNYAARTPVVFNDADQSFIGWVKLRREGDVLLGDFKLQSVMQNTSLATELMRKLTPAVAYNVVDAYENMHLLIKITYIAISNRGNADENVKPFGNKIHCLSKGMLN